MTLCAFVGDEVSAAGFRLGGVAVHVPDREGVLRLFQRLCTEAEVILMTAEVAGWLPGDMLDRALAHERPLVLVLADVRGREQPPDIAEILRHQLGIAE